MLIGGPSADEMEAMALRSLEALPAEFRAHLGDVILRVEEFASDEMLAELGIEHPMELSGLYIGIPVGDKSEWASGAMPDMIHLFRQPILAEAAERGLTVRELVHHVLIHEIGHHFGLSDDDMHALENEVP